MGELLAEIGDLVFTIVIGYISAIEFLYVVRHLYHYSCNHDTNEGVDSNENLSQLQGSMRQQLANAENKEVLAGTQVMKDGVPYKDGFRLEDQLIDQLKEKLKDKELSDLRRQELEKELAKQTKTAEILRKEIVEAEAKYQHQLNQEAKAKKLLEEQRQREQEESAKKETEEQARRLAEAEKQKETERQKLLEKQKQREQEEHAKKEAEEQARQLAEAEKQKETGRQKRQEEESIKKETEEKAKERKMFEEKERREAEEQALKLIIAERQREAEQRQREDAEENVRRLQELEKQRENEQRMLEEREREQNIREEATEAEKNARRLLEIEKANEEKQAVEEAAAELAAKKLLAIEHQLEEQLRAAESEAELTENVNEDEVNKHKEDELLRKILQAREQLGEESEEEQSLRLLQREKEQEANQKRIEENALLFLEAEKEMAELQSKMLEAVEKKYLRGGLDSSPQTPIIEEPFIKRTFSPLSDAESTHSTVKTQLAQDLDKSYSVKTKPLLFPSVSDDASSIDPASSQKSSFSTHPSEEITTGTDSQYPPLERQEPDGEDNHLIQQQYSDDYLRSLDGIKQRPLVREDGSGRRRAFKKRRSSNSSTSSRESRQSRDEELKMFTSLEEEEMKDTADSEFMPIRYSTDPTLKVRGHHRRHKRSPAKDMRRGDDSLRSSLERLGEGTSDPWGEVKPEHYKHTEFWKREKTLSIDEETEFKKPTSSEETTYNTATNLPSASSFEEATQKQNQEALTALQQHSAQRNAQESTSDEPANIQQAPAQSGNTNLELSLSTEEKNIGGQPSIYPRLRLSPRKEEANKSPSNTAQGTPVINVQTPLDDGPWRDEYGLLIEGLSDFYDFTASVNPSRSRSASRNVSPANTAPNTPLPKNVAFQLSLANEKVHKKTIVEIYDDAEDYQTDEFKKENIIKFINTLSGKERLTENENSNDKTVETEVEIRQLLKNVADDPSSTSNEVSLIPLVNVIKDTVTGTSPNLEGNDSSDMDMNILVSSLRSQQPHKPSSRSKSPLPTADNLKRSVENRRYKMIKHNEDILEKLIESKLLPELTQPVEEEEKDYCRNNAQSGMPNIAETEPSPQVEVNALAQSLQIDQRRSRSKSPMRLPTPENLSKGLEKRRSKLIERNDDLIKQMEERSQTPESPIVVIEHVYEIESTEGSGTFEQSEKILPPNEDDECTKEQMDLLVQSLRVARSKTRSKSPFCVQEVQNINETSTYYGFHSTEYIEATQRLDTSIVPTISIDFLEAESQPNTFAEHEEQEDCSEDNMDLLIRSLRAARGKSTSRSPMPDSTLMCHMEERAQTPEPSTINRTEFVGERSRHSRSKSPSRSHSASPDLTTIYRSNTPSRSLFPPPEEYDDCNTIFNSNESRSKSLTLGYQEQKQLDEKALEKLRNASEEVELKTLSAWIVQRDELNEEQSQDRLTDMTLLERTKFLKKSPSTPDYDRTVSEEVCDNERIKQEMLTKGFKRSTYVGESMDLGSEFEPLRKEAAKFQRSRSPSPSFSTIESATAQRNAEEKRKIQDIILQELATNSTVDPKEYKSTGAIPKTERYTSTEMERPSNSEMGEVKRVDDRTFKKFFQTDNLIENFEEIRRRNAEFRRSASASRSPLREAQKEELASIEIEAAKRVLQDKIIDEVSSSSFKFQGTSRNLNTDFFKNDRRASDSVLMKVPEILVQLKDDEDMEPEEYHHYRRFSLAQEEPQEQYPGDDYIFIQQVEVRTRSGSRTWLREDFYSENVEDYLKRGDKSSKNSVEKENAEPSSNEHHQMEGTNAEKAVAVDEDEEYSNPSDDDRQTVVEVDDEIDEDISDFNERGPAEESHHEISECEEAEREVDRYAGREASYWNRTTDVENVLYHENRSNQMRTFEENEGAVGGFSSSPYDSDSFAIDQIYDEAIKNRKQSGILREYDSILKQISSSSDVDEQYLLWSKANSKKTPKNIEFNTTCLDNERKETEMRYLGDASTTARQSARLHSRYGYKPILQAQCLEDGLEVDLNYKPKREYNWRKNFKLDDVEIKEDKEISLDEIYSQQEKYDIEIEKHREDTNHNEERDQSGVCQSNLVEESVTLFSHSLERNLNLTEESFEEVTNLKSEISTKEKTGDKKHESCEKSKKKKTKKKSHKESKASLVEIMNLEDEEAYDNQVYSRRSSSMQMEIDSPKRKSHSRRSSKSSLTNEDSLGLFSPRSSVAYHENIEDIMEEHTEAVKETTRPKKMKKRKKMKEVMANVDESPIENREEIQFSLEALIDIPPVSAAITPESSSANVLSTLSPQNSVCITPASIESDINISTEELLEITTSSSTTTTTDSSPSVVLSRTSSITTATTMVDTFDILKDANFYPLF